MSKISDVFQKRPAFVGYLTAGDGGIEHTLECLKALVKGGVDIIEIGVPFSDPVADGPAIQAASARALENGTTIEDVFELVQKFRQYSNVPVILFSYYNPIYIASQKYDFFNKAKEAGVDGCLIVDIPVEESDQYYQNCIKSNIDPIFLISPSTPMERIQLISQKSRGMLYYVCRKGTTGVKSELPEDLIEKIEQIKSVSSLPVVVGFGISNQEMAKSVIQYADGFVVGSLFVKAAAEKIELSQLTDLVSSIDPRK